MLVEKKKFFFLDMLFEISLRILRSEVSDKDILFFREEIKSRFVFDLVENRDKVDNLIEGIV